MKKQITEWIRENASMKGVVISLFAILYMIGFINLASAMYSGESYSFETNLTDPVYTVTGNSSSLEGLTVEFENGNITIVSDPLMASDNFTMVFFDEVTNEIETIVYRGGGGGSSRTKYVDRNITTYVPVYTNDTVEVEVERVVDNTIVEEGWLRGWMIVLAVILSIALTMLVVWLIERDSEEAGDGKQETN